MIMVVPFIRRVLIHDCPACNTSVGHFLRRARLHYADHVDPTE